MSTSPVWTISASGISGEGRKLVGCHIKQTPTNYQFTAPNNDVLATTSGTTLPQTFSPFNYENLDWVVALLTAVVGGNATGEWNVAATPQDFTPESGNYIAYTGLGIDEGEAASSAHT